MSNTECDRVKCVHNKMCNYLFELFNAQYTNVIDCNYYEEEKPQGEWIECTKSGMPLTEYGRMTGEKWYGFKCSQCNFIYKGNALIDSPFCQKCGADMRGGRE